MSERLLAIPAPCQHALEAIQQDPLDLPKDVADHVRTCPACQEARVQWLAQEDAPMALAPAGYFERLPGRVLRKLPTRKSRRPHAALWMAAAGLALAVGIGGYIAGKSQNAPLVQAELPATSQELILDMPFEETDDPMSQFSNLSPEEADAVLQRMDISQP